MKKRTTTLAIVLLVMGSVIVYYCLTNDLGGFMTDKTIANTSVIQTRNSAIETKETTVQQPNKETNRKIYQTVEQMPRFPGGDTAMLKYIRENLRYPQAAIEKEIQGRVIVKLVVNTDGTLSDIYVIKPLDPQCDQEAIRIIQSMPRWIPGRHNGVAVPVYYLVPVTFKI